MTKAPGLRPVVFIAVVVALLVLSVALMLALQRGTLLVAALSGGMTSAILLGVARVTSNLMPRISAMLVGAALVPPSVLALMSPGAGAVGVAVAATGFVLGIWGPVQSTLTVRSVDPTP